MRTTLSSAFWGTGSGCVEWAWSSSSTTTTTTITTSRRHAQGGRHGSCANRLAPEIFPKRAGHNYLFGFLILSFRFRFLLFVEQFPRFRGLGMTTSYAQTTMERRWSAAKATNGTCPAIQLSTASGGLAMPALGFGTCCRTSSKGPALVASIRSWLAAGGRLIDTAMSYDNHADVRAAVEEWVELGGRRHDLWITSKVDTVHEEGGAEAVQESVARALSELGTPYLDLMLLHHPQCKQPHGFASTAACLHSSWDGLAAAQAAGKVRAIGVSNFNRSQLEDLMAVPGSVAPAVNQIELHPLVGEDLLVLAAWCKRHGIAVTAYNSLGGAKGAMALANDRKYARIAAQCDALTRAVLLSRRRVNQLRFLLHGRSCRRSRYNEWQLHELCGLKFELHVYSTISTQSYNYRPTRLKLKGFFDTLSMYSAMLCT